MNSKPSTVFDAINSCGHDMDFSPNQFHESEFLPTDFCPGSEEKKAVIAERAEQGLPLWHPDDRKDYSGLVGAIVPRGPQFKREDHG